MDTKKTEKGTDQHGEAREGKPADESAARATNGAAEGAAVSVKGHAAERTAARGTEPAEGEPAAEERKDTEERKDAEDRRDGGAGSDADAGADTAEGADEEADEEAAPERTAAPVAAGAAAVVGAALGLASITGTWMGTILSERQTVIGQIKLQAGQATDQIATVYGAPWHTTALVNACFALLAVIVSGVALLRPRAVWIRALAFGGLALGILGLLISAGMYFDLFASLPKFPMAGS